MYNLYTTKQKVSGNCEMKGDGGFESQGSAKYNVTQCNVVTAVGAVELHTVGLVFFYLRWLHWGKQCSLHAGIFFSSVA